MAVNLLPIGNDAPFILPTGVAASGAKLFTYTAGSSTKATTYTDNTGGTPNANPIILNSSGYPASAGNVVEIWGTSGVSYKFILAPSTDTDPPASPYWTRDNIAGINDVTATASEWISGPAPTFVSATQFTLVGDQTGTFTVGRRLKTTNTGGTVYSTITVSAYTSLTTVTVVNDSGTLDSGLSAVSYGLLASTNESVPELLDNTFRVDNRSDPTKKIAFDASGITTGTTRTLKSPDASGTLLLASNIPLRSYLAGLGMSTAGGSGTMSIAAGLATDSTGAVSLTIAAFSKTTSAFTAGSGNGGLDTGAIANTTWYHFYVISTAAGALTDILISLSATSPTLPATYTLFRRIGSGKTDGSAHWIAFTQDGDYFRWSASVRDVSSTNPGTSAVTATLGSIPTGVNVHALINALLTDASQANAIYLSDLSASDEAPSTSAAPGAQLVDNNLTSTAAAWGGTIRTNTSAQIRYRLVNSGASTVVILVSLGWWDYRGRNA